METIKIKSGIKYLSEVINELPKNCIFNKVETGCGGTTLAINSNEDYVIAVPFVTLVDNKIAQHKELFGVKGGVTVADVDNYLRKTDRVKIIVTYDSLPKVVEALKDRVATVNILIDELHILFKHYSFRKQAIKPLLEMYSRFKSFCFMSATPTDDEFMLKELRDINRVVCEWDSPLSVKVNAIKCLDVESTVINIINEHLNNGYEQNLYFFVNSIKFINSICRKTGLYDGIARMICSEYNESSPKELEVSNTLSKPKKINFITSTAFEGADLFDEEAIIYAVSDSSKAHTLMDISTDMQQIAGRIRDSKYRGLINHLYSTTRYSDVSYEEFKESSDNLIAESDAIVIALNDVNSPLYGKVGTILNPYIIKKEYTTDWEFDENLVLVDMGNYKRTHSTYSLKAMLDEEYLSHNIDAKFTEDYSEKVRLINEATSTSSEYSFKDFVQELNRRDVLVKNKELNIMGLNALKTIAYSKYPILKDAIQVLGYNTIGTLKYSQKSIKQALIEASSMSLPEKQYELLRLMDLTSGTFITKKDLKERIQSVYNRLEVNKKAKATDITDWFEVKESNLRLNGEQTKGYTIIRQKVRVL